MSQRSQVQTTANDILRDTAHRIYNGLLFSSSSSFFSLSKALRFYGTGINDSNYTHKIMPSLSRFFTKLTDTRQRNAHFSYTEFQPHRTINMVNTDRFITLTGTVWISPRRLARDTVSKHLRTSPVRNFIQIGRKRMNIWTNN